MPKRPIVVERQDQYVEENFLEEDMTFVPETARRFFVSNLIQRTLATLVGWTGLRFRRLRCTAAGVLKTAPVGAGFEWNDTKTGVTAATWSARIAFDEPVSRIDIRVWAGDIDIQFESPLQTWMDTITIPAGMFRSIDLATPAFRVRNAGGGATSGNYEIVGYW